MIDAWETSQLTPSAIVAIRTAADPSGAHTAMLLETNMFTIQDEICQAIVDNVCL